MIRKAVKEDLGQIEEGYREHFQYEREHTAFTVFREGVYPTGEDAKRALEEETLYVYVEDGTIAASMILDGRQPEEYKEIDWPGKAKPEEVLVLHLLLVRPSMHGKGIGTAMVNYAVEAAGRLGCRAVRLDTGKQNVPAASLYVKAGFRQAGSAGMKVGGRISHGGHLFFEKEVGDHPA